MRRRLLSAAGSILLGWLILLLIAWLPERALLMLIAGRLGASWFPTVRLILDCSVLAITGWVIGRLSPSSPLLTVAAFAATLTFWDFGELLEIRVPWLLQLAGDALRDPRYWDSLVYTAAIQAFLFGSLFTGARLNRHGDTTALSIVGNGPPGPRE
jgi:hypothetical protein